MIKNSFVVLIFFILILLFPYVEASQDQVCFYKRDMNEEYENIIIFVGEYQVYLKIVFGQNCSNWMIDVNSPLFLHPLKVMTRESVNTGQRHGTSLDINPNAPLGRYPIVVYFNYTNEQNMNISNRFDLSIEYIKSFEVKNIQIPKGNERLFSLKVETFVEFTELKVIFDSDGDIETEKEEIIYNNLSKGNYTFETKIYNIDSFPGDAQELGYHIIGIVDNRTIELLESNIPVSISWDENKKIRNIYDVFRIIILSIIIILTVIIFLFYYQKYKKRKND